MDNLLENDPEIERLRDLSQDRRFKILLKTN